jgi:hypothetical protein
VHVAHCLALAKGNAALAASAAKSRDVAHILEVGAAGMWPPSIAEQKATMAGIKAAVAPGTTYTAHWAAEIAAFQAIASSFIAGLKGYCAFDTMAADFVPLPPHIYTAYIGLGGTKTGSTPGEWLPIPATDMSISADFLRERLSYALIALSEDVLKFGQGFDMLNNGLRRKLKRAVDTFFLSDIIGTTGIVSNPGTGDFARDLEIAALQIHTSDDSRLYCVAPPSVVKAAAFARGTGGAPTFPNVGINGGDARGIKLIPSDSLTNSAVVLDAAQCAAYTDGPVVLDYSAETSVEMADNPTAQSSRLVSMFSENARAVRIQRLWAFNLLDAGAAAVITAITTA